MKVTFVTIQFPVASEAFAAVEVRALRRLGADISIMTYRAAPPNAAEMLAERDLADVTIAQGGFWAAVRAFPLCFLRATDSLWLTAKVLRYCWRSPTQLAKALALVPQCLSHLQKLEKDRPDVLHLFWGHLPSLLGLLVKRRLPNVVVSQFLGAYDLEQRFPLSALMARQVDLGITHARANLRAIAELGINADDFEVVYRGVDIPRPLPALDKVPGLMVVAERLVAAKRTADSLRIFAEVSRMHPEVRLEILGSGPERDKLAALAQDLGVSERVHFAGHLPHAEVFKKLSGATVAISMSRSHSERLPNFLKEAMLHQCLCLSARSPGIDELITDGETGLIVEHGDTSGAARRLAALLDEPEATARVGRQAQARIIEDFDVDRIMATRLQTWQRLREALIESSAV